VSSVGALSAATTRPAPARHIFFALAASALLMASIDSTIVAVAIPQLTTALSSPLAWVAWTLTAYQLVQVVMLPLAGKLSDSLGRKKVFLFCVGMFTFGSLLCGLAPTIWFLIAARALQAVGGGGLMPSAVGLVSDQYRERRAQAIGLFASVFPIGGILGPNLGGLILQHWTWREMFFINLPIGIVSFLGVAILLPKDVFRQARHIDWPGVGLYAGGIVLLLATITSAADDPGLWRNPLLWVAVIASAALFVVFLRYIRRASDPIMDYGLVVRQPFLNTNLYNLVYGAAVFGFTSFIPAYAVSRYGMSAFQSGAVMTPRGLAMVVSSIVASMWVIKLGYRLPMLAGMGLVALALALLGIAPTALQIGGMTIDGFWIVAGILAIGGLGTGLSAPASNNAALDLAPQHSAALTGIRSTFRLTGGALSISTIVLALTFFDDPGRGLSVAFECLAVVVLLAMTIAWTIPDAARDRARANAGPTS
jgi:EmrB/QacA subfamily drug resistance transporter